MRSPPSREAAPRRPVTTTASMGYAHDTVSGGDWLCDQMRSGFRGRGAQELVQLEHWGCPWEP